ncbi:hypothetical protein [Melittangium boletus]|uniref:Uncharacterized protein n=1 Tax=Melittangium boletus DSM 14713 TaxID=1294270 RepID=A0A250IGC8_9BACT|nr:hypothetical protein [Melittangium boletus]ATB29996.1 hypothetical protein MEBOL_003451 [Melittangium boletus DSM 14713]
MSDSQAKRLIFTPDLMLLVKRNQQYSGPLLHRLALIDGTEGEALRDQIECAAAAVPGDKHQRVLGPIRGKKSSDDQVMDALGTLLLAKTLADLDWEVEYEPEEAGGTPDLRIRKGNAVYLVEVRRAAGPLRDVMSKDISRLRDALSGLKTRTPIGIRRARINGQSSLKPFLKHLQALLAVPRPDEIQVFDQDGVYVQFHVHKALETEVSALAGWMGAPMHGQNLDAVRAAIHEKLGKYKVPLIVALDLRNLPESFHAMEDIVLGQTIVKVPIRTDGGDFDDTVQVVRANDSIFAETGSNGERARTRLQALLPFQLRSLDSKLYTVQVRVFANPVLDPFLQLHEFDPIPRFIVTEETAEGRVMNYMVGNTRVSDTSELADCATFRNGLVVNHLHVRLPLHE